MKPGTRRDIENFHFLPPLQNIDEELAFAFCPGIPIDQRIPFFNETLNVFFLIVLGIPYFEWFFAKILFNYGRHVVLSCCH